MTDETVFAGLGVPLGTCASGWRHRPADPEAALLDCDAVRRWGQDLARLKTEDDAAPALRARTNELPALDLAPVGAHQL